MTSLEFSTSATEHISITEFQEALGAFASATEVSLFIGATGEATAAFDSSM